MAESDKPRVFAALLRFWRQKRGLSQLDLAAAAEISTRHLSFLETGRSNPSRELVLILGSMLDVPLRDQNALLVAAGFAEAFQETNLKQSLPSVIERAISRMFEKHEPFPMMAFDRVYNVVRANQSATRLVTRFVKDPSAMTNPPNIMRMLFDSRLVRDYVVGWETVAKVMLSRLYRETIARPYGPLSDLIAELLDYPDVPGDFRIPDLLLPNDPVLALSFKHNDLTLSFLTTVTTFDAPRNVTLSELRLESYFPLDSATERACEEM